MIRLICLFGLALIAVGCDAATPREKLANQLRAQQDIFTPYPAPGLTYASFDTGHGYQVEYLAADGTVYLWYPGNGRTVVGEWKAILDDVCYRYGAETFNPQTFQFGGAWSCEHSARHDYYVVAFQSGDAFGLASGRIPYIRDRCDLPEGMKRVKKVSCR